MLKITIFFGNIRKPIKKISLKFENRLFFANKIKTIGNLIPKQKI
jgi:hypothetical protein